MTEENWYDTAVSAVVTALEAVFLKKSDVVDNLTTNDGSKALSAKQGKVLNDQIGDAIVYINGNGGN